MVIASTVPRNVFPATEVESAANDDDAMPIVAGTKIAAEKRISLFMAVCPLGFGRPKRRAEPHCG